MVLDLGDDDLHSNLRNDLHGNLRNNLRNDLHRNIDLPMAMQSRLAGLARRHQTAILCLTEKSRDERSLGSLVSLRVEAVRTEKVGDRFRYEVRIIKDKHSGSGHSDGGWRPEDLVWKEACHAPDGLC